MHAPPPTVSVVIPAYNAAGTLGSVLQALRRAEPEIPIVVVDPASEDETGRIATAFGAQLVRLPRRAGPAEARNAGVDHVESEVVLFLDADCVPHENAVERVRAGFAADPRLVSLTGSYDAHPPEPNFFSQYMNLRHHLTHQRARREDATFWAGCGAVRRRAFLAAGGFDAKRFPKPMVEDIELRARIAALGSTRLDPALQVTHLKRWTLRSVVATDIRQRAIPWASLILDSGGLPDDLNLRRSERSAAALAPFVLSSPLLVAWGAFSGRLAPLALAAACVLGSLWLQRELVAGFRRARGPGFALGAWLFHQVHLTYSAATLTACAALRVVRRPAPRTAGRSLGDG